MYSVNCKWTKFRKLSLLYIFAIKNLNFYRYHFKDVWFFISILKSQRSWYLYFLRISRNATFFVPLKSRNLTLLYISPKQKRRGGRSNFPLGESIRNQINFLSSLESESYPSREGLNCIVDPDWSKFDESESKRGTNGFVIASRHLLESENCRQKGVLL